MPSSQRSRKIPITIRRCSERRSRCISSGKLDEAGELYRKLLPANANSAELLVNLIALSTARKEDGKVKEFAERLLKLRPQSRQALQGLAAVALGRGDYSAAVQHCSQLVKVAADSYEGWFNLGVAYQKTGRLEQAGNAYREATRHSSRRGGSQRESGRRFCRSAAIWPARGAPMRRVLATPAGSARRAVESGAGGGARRQTGRSRKVFREAGGREAGFRRRGVPAGLSATAARRIRRRGRQLRNLPQETQGLGGSAAESGPGLLEVRGSGRRVGNVRPRSGPAAEKHRRHARADRHRDRAQGSQDGAGSCTRS